jgi:hypothetical protein
VDEAAKPVADVLPRNTPDPIDGLPRHRDRVSWARYARSNDNDVAAVLVNDVWERAVNLVKWNDDEGVVVAVVDGCDDEGQ